MNKFFIILLYCSILFSISVSAFSQVTIGSSNSPIAGSLLDLKEYPASAGGVTATKGFTLPRVKLLSLTITNSSTGVASTIADAPTDKLWDKDEHIGLTVYHIDACTLNGKGVYTWTGDTWVKLGSNFGLDGLQLSTNNLLFYNGVNSTQNVTVNWAPTTGYTPPTYTGTGATFTFSPLSGTLSGSSPQTVGITVANMSESELSANLFASKPSTVTFSFANSPCGIAGGPQTQTINVNQVNKALKVNGKVIPDQVDITTSGPNTATLESNARWQFESITPISNGAVSSVEVGAIKGTELDDGTAVPNTISYNAISAANLHRYNYLTFSDTHSPKRFGDIVLTVAQCAGNNDLTMREYVDLWESTFGLIQGVDEPNSDGDITKNTRGVRWHYTRPDLPANDVRQSIFFSALFGTGRFMITNLQTKTYTPRTDTPTTEWTAAPSLTNSYAATTSPYTTAYWGYPNINGTTDAALTTQYAARERLGLLYNWAAATGNENNSTGTQTNTVFAKPIQGICPAGWHLPSNVEWNAFLTDVSNNPTKYSTNTVTGTSSAGITLKDICEPYTGSGRGKSFDLFAGGFNVLISGGAASGSAILFGSSTKLWSASSYDTNQAYIQLIINSSGLALSAGDNRSNLSSVRCMKD